VNIAAISFIAETRATPAFVRLGTDGERTRSSRDDAGAAAFLLCRAGSPAGSGPVSHRAVRVGGAARGSFRGLCLQSGGGRYAREGARADDGADPAAVVAGGDRRHL